MASKGDLKSLHKRTHSASFGYEAPEPRAVRKRSRSPSNQAISLRPKEWVKMFRQHDSSKSTMSESQIRAGIKSLNANEARQLLTALLDKSATARKNFARELPMAVKGATDAQIKSLKVNQARQILNSLADKYTSVKSLIAKDLPSFVKGASGSKQTAKAASSSQVAGLYDIEAPSLDTPEGHTFEVYPSSTSSHLWASFDLGVVSGVMRSIYAPPTTFDTNVYFEWRGRECGEDVITFSSDNRAVITFLPGGLLEGKISVPRHGTFKIYGCIQVSNTLGAVIPRKGAQDQQLEVRSYKKTWRGLNEHNYDIENTERWGKWGGNTKDDQAFESDTTAGKGKRRSKINLKNFMREPDTDPDDDSDEDSDEENSDDDSEDDSLGEDSEDDSEEIGTGSEHDQDDEC